MNNETVFLIFLLASRLPIYAYVVYKAWTLRHKIVLISSNWLGAVALAGMMGALGNVFADKITSNILGSVFAFCLFMLGFTARELKRVKE